MPQLELILQVIAKSLGLKRTLKKPSLKDGKKRGSKKKLVTKSLAGGDSDLKKGEQGCVDGVEKGPDEKKGSLTSEEEQILVLNLLFHFLFAELKDTPRLRQ